MVLEVNMEVELEARAEVELDTEADVELETLTMTGIEDGEDMEEFKKLKLEGNELELTGPFSRLT